MAHPMFSEVHPMFRERHADAPLLGEMHPMFSAPETEAVPAPAEIQSDQITFHRERVNGTNISLEMASLASKEEQTESVFSVARSGFTAVISGDTDGRLRSILEREYTEAVRMQQNRVDFGQALSKSDAKALFDQVAKAAFADFLKHTSAPIPSLTLTQLIERSGGSSSGNNASMLVMSTGSHSVAVQTAEADVEKLFSKVVNDPHKTRLYEEEIILRRGDKLIITNGKASDVVRNGAKQNESVRSVVNRIKRQTMLQRSLLSEDVLPVAVQRYQKTERRGWILPAALLLAGTVAVGAWLYAHHNDESERFPQVGVSASATPSSPSTSTQTYPTKGDCGYDVCQPSKPPITPPEGVPSSNDYPLKAAMASGACYEKTFTNNRAYMALQNCKPYNNPSMIAFGQLWQLYGGQGKNINYAQIDAVEKQYAVLMGTDISHFNRLAVGTQIPLLTREEITKVLANHFGDNLGFTIKPTGDDRSKFPSNCV